MEVILNQVNWKFHENDVKTKLKKIDKEMKELIQRIKAEFLSGWKKQANENYNHSGRVNK